MTEKSRRKIAVFASGSGSNFQAIADAVSDGVLEADVALLVCDKPGAFVVQRAREANVDSFVFSAKDYSSKAEYEEVILAELKKRGVELIVLAGYMRLIGNTLLERYEEAIVNIHPSLLPAFPGKDAIGQALAAGIDYTGVTVHYVDQGMDTGPIIKQHILAVQPGETKESLQHKIQKIEHQLYVKVLQEML
jgi:phosphoribosylglycinamide formyltransferase-1